MKVSKTVIIVLMSGIMLASVLFISGVFWPRIKHRITILTATANSSETLYLHCMTAMFMPQFRLTGIF